MAVAPCHQQNNHGVVEA